jgi:hypothetical protein
MVMMIFVFLHNSVKYQILNKRFYNGIHPHWFKQIKKLSLMVRLTEDAGVSRSNLTYLEFPTLDYIENLATTQRKAIYITGASLSSDNCRFNIFLSTGHQSKVGDWEK